MQRVFELIIKILFLLLIVIVLHGTCIGATVTVIDDQHLKYRV